ncbi:hypothetical protein JL722_254 [Aureococcus anophagefferens]|nr:hypothetical protein JL722_254 [Aureococcus anophagefferens]
MSQQRAHAGNHEANPYEEIHEVDEETGEIFVSIKRRPSPSPSSHAAMAYELDGEDAVDFAGMMNALGVEVDEAAADAEAWPAEAADDESLERAALARSSSAEHKRADAEFAAALSASEVYEEEARSSRRRAAESADEAYARAIFASLAAAERDDVDQDAVVAKALACEDEDDAERGARTRAEVDLSGDADLAFALDLQEAAAGDDGDFALRLAAEERDATARRLAATRRRRGAAAPRRGGERGRAAARAPLGARGDPAYRQAKALRDRMYRQRDVAAALFFAANNGALLGPDAAVHRCSEIGFEGVVDVAVAACGTHFGVGHDVLIDLHWLSARDATFVAPVGAPKLGAAVRACLEKRPRLKAAEVRPGVFDVRVRAASP